MLGWKLYREPFARITSIILLGNDGDRCGNCLRACMLCGGRSLLSARGGLVVLVSPYAWLREWTSRAEWLSNDGKSSGALETIMKSMKFQLVAREEMPFLLLQNDRIGEMFVSELTAWYLPPR